MKLSRLTLIAAPLLAALSLAGGALGQYRDQGQASRNTEARAAGEALFRARCASCHEPAVERAPDKASLAGRWAIEIFDSLKTGRMAPMAEGLSDEQMTAIAFYLTGGRPDREAIPTVGDPPACATADRFALEGPHWSGWSIDPRNWRLQPDPGLTAAEVPRLKVKWAMTYVGGRYGQPAVAGGRLFVTSSSGRVYSLDAKTGCLRWRFDAPTGVRTTVSVGALAKAPSGYAAYFGDFQGRVFALDAASGRQIWMVDVDDHPRGVLTGAPVLHKDRLYVPISSWEETVADAPNYQCCTARGAVAAIDVRTGRLVWKTYAVPDPRPFRKNAAGTQMFGPAGAAVWSAPTIDEKRGVLYVATGDSYTDVKEDGSDAIIAMDLRTGRIRWKRQITEGDNFLMGCGPQRRGVNCPEAVGPDHDFGASPILTTLPSGKDILLVGQKSGEALGLDPDARGRIVWRNKIGAGGPLGGIEWGMATDGTRLYAANADAFAAIYQPPGAEPPAPRPGARGGQTGAPGLFALDPATGRTLWRTPAPKVPCGWPRANRCLNAQSAAPTVIPGLVLAGTTDGHLRAYRPETGEIVWDVDTGGGRYATINGVDGQPGGSIDVAGPVVAGGMLYIMSGYSGTLAGKPDNVLLAFSVDGE